MAPGDVIDHTVFGAAFAGVDEGFQDEAGEHRLGQFRRVHGVQCGVDRVLLAVPVRGGGHDTLFTSRRVDPGDAPGAVVAQRQRPGVRLHVRILIHAQGDERDGDAQLVCDGVQHVPQLARQGAWHLGVEQHVHRVMDDPLAVMADGRQRLVAPPVHLGAVKDGAVVPVGYDLPVRAGDVRAYGPILHVGDVIAHVNLAFRIRYPAHASNAHSHGLMVPMMRVDMGGVV